MGARRQRRPALGAAEVPPAVAYAADRPRMPRAAKLAIAGLLAAFVVQASLAARRDSVTIDEFVHLPVGLHILYTGDATLDPINPPLARMIAALPLLVRPPAFAPEPGMSHWPMGYHLLERNVDRYQQMYVSARFMVTLLGVMLGVLVAGWSNALYGWPSALVATFLFVFSPCLLAHGHLVTLDMAGALGFVATAYTTWRLLASPTATNAVALGTVLAVATLLKLSGFVLVLAVLVLLAIRALGERPVRVRWRDWLLRWAALCVVAGASALLVLNLGYRFQGTMTPLAGATLDPAGWLAGLAARWPALRLPLPRPFLEGVDMVLNVGKGQEPSYFLAGELSADGWWYYHLAAFALKSPIPLLLAGAAGLVQWALGRSRGERDYAVVVPLVLLFAANSLFNSLYIGVRHVLPAYPLLAIVASPVLARPIVTVLSRRPREAVPLHLRRRLELGYAALSIGLMVWMLGGTLAIAPRYLQYFNEAAGGPENGHRMLIDSNLDWGQDLLRLAEYMRERRLPWIHLAYFGRVDPSAYGIRYVPLQRGQAHGTVAISASFLMGRPYFWLLNGRMQWVKSGTYTWLQQYEPVARVGSMFVFELP